MDIQDISTHLSFSSNAKLWAWYGFMVAVCAVGNCAFLAFQWYRTKGGIRGYSLAMRVLAIPWVVDCAYRAVFPSLYMERLAFWDTPLNSIMIGRTLAFFGELSWTFQVTLAVRYIDSQLSKTWWVQGCGWVSFMVYVVAEGVAYYNTATMNQYWGAVEVILDGVSYLFLLPAAAYIWWRCPKSDADRGARTFSFILMLVAVGYPVYNFTVVAPMYMKRYHEDQENHKQYLPFLKGMVDATVNWTAERKYSKWSGDMVWMVLYFTLGCWTGILLMVAPAISERLPLYSESLYPTLAYPAGTARKDQSKYVLLS